MQKQIRLTRREEQVIAAIARGMRDASIAQELGISRRTVNKHVENILGKFDVHTRAAAVARWMSVAWTFSSPNK